MTNKKLINLNYNDNINENLLLKCKIQQFPCGEFEFSIQENVTESDIEIYQSFENGKFNDNLIKLQIVCDVLKKNSVKNISYFSPFLPYSRQDKTYNKTTSLGIKLITDIINSCGITKITTYDIHNLQSESFFQGKFYNLSAIPLFLEDIEKKFNKNDIVIVFPDAGACSRFKQFFKNKEYNIAIINKTRTETGLKMKILGKVDNKTAIIIDDMIDSGETIIKASKLLKSHNVKNVIVYATHGILSGNAVKNLIKTYEIDKITITNSIIQNKKLNKKFKIINLS